MQAICIQFKTTFGLQRLEAYVKTTEQGVFGLLYGLHHEGKTHIFASAMGTTGKPAEFTTAAENFQDVTYGNGKITRIKTIIFFH